MKVNDLLINKDQFRIFRLKKEWALKLICWDPKGGDLLLIRVKVGEILLEARRDSDVQIDLQNW